MHSLYRLLGASQDFWQSGQVRQLYAPLVGPKSDHGTDTSRRRLARMDRMEEFADQCDRFEKLHGDEFAAWELPAMKLHFANTYRRLVGVYPSERHRLRAELEHCLAEQSAILKCDAPGNGNAGLLSGNNLFA